jgi:hypothetical protein
MQFSHDTRIEFQIWDQFMRQRKHAHLITGTRETENCGCGTWPWIFALLSTFESLKAWNTWMRCPKITKLMKHVFLHSDEYIELAETGFWKHPKTTFFGCFQICARARMFGHCNMHATDRARWDLSIHMLKPDLWHCNHTKHWNKQSKIDEKIKALRSGQNSSLNISRVYGPKSIIFGVGNSWWHEIYGPGAMSHVSNFLPTSIRPSLIFEPWKHKCGNNSRTSGPKCILKVYSWSAHRDGCIEHHDDHFWKHPKMTIFGYFWITSERGKIQSTFFDQSIDLEKSYHLIFFHDFLRKNPTY